MGPGPQNDVLTAKSDQFRNPQSRLDGHDQEGSVPAADPRGGVWRGDQCIDLLAVEKLDQPALMAFVRHGEHTLAKQCMGGLLQGDILKERMDCSQAGIAGARAVAPFLFEMIEELPDDQRDVLIMRIYKDMSFKEISECTGVSINTALGRMRYALINIRKMIEEREIVLQ